MTCKTPAIEPDKITQPLSMIAIVLLWLSGVSATNIADGASKSNGNVLKAKVPSVDVNQ